MSVLVQVAGCLLELPDDDSPSEDQEKQASRAGFFSRRPRKRRVLTRDLEGIRKCREMDEIPDANYDLLEFPAYVNSRGVLRFYNWSRSRQEMQDHHSVSAYRKLGDIRSGESEEDGNDEVTISREEKKKKDKKKNKGGGHQEAASSATAHQKRPSPETRLEDDLDYPDSLLNVWVQRVTDPLYLLPKLQWVYVYIIAVGEEQEPPRLFGRLPLQGSSKVKRFLEGNTGDDGSWPPPQALLKAKKRDVGQGDDDHDDDWEHMKNVDAPGGNEKTRKHVFIFFIMVMATNQGSPVFLRSIYVSLICLSVYPS